MSTNNKLVFKMVFTLKENADPVKFAEIIDEMLACYKTCCSKEIHGNIVEFSLSVSKRYSNIVLKYSKTNNSSFVWDLTTNYELLFFTLFLDMIQFM